MRGSNAEIVWRRARASRQRSAAPSERLYFGCRVEPDASKKTSLYAHPGLSYIAAGHRRPLQLKSDASRAMYA